MTGALLAHLFLLEVRRPTRLPLPQDLLFPKEQTQKLAKCQPLPPAALSPFRPNLLAPSIWARVFPSEATCSMATTEATPWGEKARFWSSEALDTSRNTRTPKSVESWATRITWRPEGEAAACERARQATDRRDHSSILPREEEDEPAPS